MHLKAAHSSSCGGKQIVVIFPASVGSFTSKRSTGGIKIAQISTEIYTLYLVWALCRVRAAGSDLGSSRSAGASGVGNLGSGNRAQWGELALCWWEFCQAIPGGLAVKEFCLSCTCLSHPSSIAWVLTFWTFSCTVWGGRLIHSQGFLSVISLQTVSSPSVWLQEWSSRFKQPFDIQERFQVKFPSVFLLLTACVNTKYC